MTGPSTSTETLFVTVTLSVAVLFVYAALGLWLWSGHRAMWLIVAWNIAGPGLLVNIVTVAILSTPVPFRYFVNDPANLLPSTFPYVWLPTFLVQAALFGHLVVFKAISRNTTAPNPELLRTGRTQRAL